MVCKCRCVGTKYIEQTHPQVHPYIYIYGIDSAQPRDQIERFFSHFQAVRFSTIALSLIVK
jgi:hypothetical protein